MKQIVLIDDGSPDNTADIAKGYAAKYPKQIEYHWQPNRGPAAARNHGAQLAKGQYVLFLDGDDTLNDGALETFHHTFQHHADTQILLAGYCAVHGDRHKARRLKPYQGAEAILHALWMGEFSINGGMVALRTPVLRHIHYPEKIRHGEDIVFFSHAIAQYETEVLRMISVNIYHHAGSLRHQDASILDDQDAFIPLLFNPTYLSPRLMAYQHECHADKLISLARSALRLQQKQAAREYLKKAFKLYPQLFLRFKTLKACWRAC